MSTTSLNSSKGRWVMVGCQCLFLKNKTFSGVNLLTLFLYAGLGGGMLFLSLNLVQAQGYSKFESGLTLLPFTFLMIILSRYVGKLSDKYGARMFMIIGPIIAGKGLMMLASIKNFGSIQSIRLNKAVLL